jgi:hypothetical protein
MAKKIPPGDIEAGMTIVKPVMLKNGMVILGEGVTLTPAWVERLNEMEIDGIYIDAPAEQKMPLDEAIMQLDARFLPVSDRPYMIRLKEIVKKHIERLYEK